LRVAVVFTRTRGWLPPFAVANVTVTRSLTLLLTWFDIYDLPGCTRDVAFGRGLPFALCTRFFAGSGCSAHALVVRTRTRDSYTLVGCYGTFYRLGYTHLPFTPQLHLTFSGCCCTLGCPYLRLPAFVVATQFPLPRTGAIHAHGWPFGCCPAFVRWFRGCLAVGLRFGCVVGWFVCHARLRSRAPRVAAFIAAVRLVAVGSHTVTTRSHRFNAIRLLPLPVYVVLVPLVATPLVLLVPHIRTAFYKHRSTTFVACLRFITGWVDLLFGCRTPCLPYVSELPLPTRLLPHALRFTPLPVTLLQFLATFAFACGLPLPAVLVCCLDTRAGRGWF